MAYPCEYEMHLVNELRAENAQLREQLAAVTKERDELRYGNAIKYGTTHPEMYKTELDHCKEQLAACQRDAERYRVLRDGQNWPAVFYDYDEPEPLRGKELDAAIDAQKEKTA